MWFLISSVMRFLRMAKEAKVYEYLEMFSALS